MQKQACAHAPNMLYSCGLMSLAASRKCRCSLLLVFLMIICLSACNSSGSNEVSQPLEEKTSGWDNNEKTVQTAAAFIEPNV